MNICHRILTTFALHNAALFFLSTLTFSPNSFLPPNSYPPAFCVQLACTCTHTRTCMYTYANLHSRGHSRTLPFFSHDPMVPSLCTLSSGVSSSLAALPSTCVPYVHNYHMYGYHFYVDFTYQRTRAACFSEPGLFL